MADRFSIEAVFSAVDRMTKPINRMTGSTTKFSRQIRRDFARAERSVESFNRSIRTGMTRAAKVGVGVGLATLAVGIGIATREYIKFDDAIFGATARFKAAEKPGANMTKVMENLRKAARKTGAETQFTATQAAQGLDKFALAGFNSQEAIMALRSQIDLTTVTGEDFMRVADISSDLLGSFGFAALKGTAKIEKLKQMNALLAVGTLSANVTMEDLFQTLKSGAPIASKAGISMNDMIATVSVLGSAGIKSGDAATAMKNIFLRLVAPIGEVKKGFKKLGLSQADFINEQGKLKNVPALFKVIGERMKGMTAVESAGIFKNLFGMRGIAGGAVIEKNINQIREQLIRMGKDPQEVMKQTAEFMRKSLGNRLKILGSTATDLGFKFLEAFDGKGRKGIDSLTKAIKNFDPTSIVEGIKTVGSAFMFIIKAVDTFAPLLLVLGGIWIAYKASLIAVAIQQAIVNSVMLANPIFRMIAIISILIGVILVVRRNWDDFSDSAKTAIKIIGVIVGVIGALIVAGKTLGAVMGIINFVMSAGVIGAIIIVVALLIIGIIALVKNWKAVKKAVIEVWNAMKNFFSALGGGAIKVFNSALKSIKETLSSLKNDFLNLGKIIWNALFTPISSAKAAISGIVNLISRIPLIGPKISKPEKIAFGASFDSPEARRIKEEVRTEGGPVTQRDVVSQRSSRSEFGTLNIRNQSRNDADIGGSQVGPGSTLKTLSSGSWWD